MSAKRRKKKLKLNFYTCEYFVLPYNDHMCSDNETQSKLMVTSTTVIMYGKNARHMYTLACMHAGTYFMVEYIVTIPTAHGCTPYTQKPRMS